MHFFRAGWAEFARFVRVVEHQSIPQSISQISICEFNTLVSAYDGSISPLRVAPGNPAKGVSPILILALVYSYCMVELSANAICIALHD